MTCQAVYLAIPINSLMSVYITQSTAEKLYHLCHEATRHPNAMMPLPANQYSEYKKIRPRLEKDLQVTDILPMEIKYHNLEISKLYVQFDSFTQTCSVVITTNKLYPSQVFTVDHIVI